MNQLHIIWIVKEKTMVTQVHNKKKQTNEYTAKLLNIIFKYSNCH